MITYTQHTNRLANQEKLITQQAEQLKKANRQMSMLKKRLRELTRMVGIIILRYSPKVVILCYCHVKYTVMPSLVGARY